MFSKSNRRSAFLYVNVFRGNGKAVHDELQLCHFSQEKANFPNFALFLDINIQQMTNIFYLIISLFINTTRPFDYNATGKSKKLDANAAMCEKPVLLICERHFSLAE